MQIRKINEKLSFDVEAQLMTCPHGKWTLNHNCTVDCTVVVWPIANARELLLGKARLKKAAAIITKQLPVQ